ncbi:UNKNOWN [Stylonychia lemnae]|uniref:Translation initiation factor 5A C-terminal domain-containing protein n=1 Tax=Stylonychia lemnae TaxID=5949 RepID=A0A078AFU7_STYLE|nr:UNKNOWN [Stylonychia lemnae]|eukprot:CDW80362.1 UNKNOWN [Stylonychia lemnae]
MKYMSTAQICYIGYNVYNGQEIKTKFEKEAQIVHVPIIKKKTYQVIDINLEGQTQYLIMMDSDGNIREDFKLYSIPQIDEQIMNMKSKMKEGNNDQNITLGQFKEQPEFIVSVNQSDDVLQ